MSDKIEIRPSSVDTFLQCAHQWYRVFIGGGISIPNSRAAIGTAIHAGVEEMWKDSISFKQKVTAKSSMQDAAMEAFNEEQQKGLVYDAGESDSTCEKEIVAGLDVYVEDVVPWVEIPTAVEQRYTVNISGHPVVSGIAGTLDYINVDNGVISDVV